MISSTDRIVKRVLLRAPRERVWSALTDAKKFGAWFGAQFEDAFVAGKTAHGRVAHSDSQYDGFPMEFCIERIEPMHRFSYRWHPFAIDRTVDYSHEPMTLVEFTLEDADGGTMLTIVESGFDAIPSARRGDAFEANEEGWETQATRIERYVSAP